MRLLLGWCRELQISRADVGHDCQPRWDLERYVAADLKDASNPVGWGQEPIKIHICSALHLRCFLCNFTNHA